MGPLRSMIASGYDDRDSCPWRPRGVIVVEHYPINYVLKKSCLTVWLRRPDGTCSAAIRIIGINKTIAIIIDVVCTAGFRTGRVLTLVSRDIPKKEAHVHNCWPDISMWIAIASNPIESRCNPL